MKYDEGIKIQLSDHIDQDKLLNEIKSKSIDKKVENILQQT